MDELRDELISVAGWYLPEGFLKVFVGIAIVSGFIPL